MFKIYKKREKIFISYLIIILLGVLLLSTFYAKKLDLPYPKHLDCKETLFEYIVFNKCTFRLSDQ